MGDHNALRHRGRVLHIARKEMTEMLRDGRLRLAIVSLGLLLATSVVTGWRYHADVAAQQRAAQAAERARWLSQPPRDPHSAAHFGATAFKTPSPLGALDPGIDPWVGVSVFLEAHKRNPPRHAPAEDATALQRFGEVTAAATLQLLVPLVIVVLGFSAFTAEREQGTLRQLISLGVSPRTLVAGKAVGIAGALAVALVPAASLAAAALALREDVTRADVGRLAVAAACYLAYIATFVALTLAASAAARSSAVALLVLLAFWFVNGFVAPRVGAEVAGARYPVPSARRFAAEAATIAAAPAGPRVSFEQFTERLLVQYGVDSVSQLPVNPSGLWMQAGEDRSNRALDSAYARLGARYVSQERWLAALGGVAPMLSIEALSMALAGTDASHHRAFLDSAEAYRRGLVRALNQARAENPVRDGAQYLAGRALWERVPPFTYERPPLWWVVDQQRTPLALLGLWTGAAVVAAALSASRLRVVG